MAKIRFIKCFGKDCQVVNGEPLGGHCTCHRGKVYMELNGTGWMLTRAQAAMLANQLVTHAFLKFRAKKED